MKFCKKCNKDCPVEDFNRLSKSKDGLQYYCRNCLKQPKVYWQKHASEPKGKFSKYKMSAKAHNRDFELTFDEFRNLVLDNCYYCGDVGGGIDRVDSSKGYILSNCVPCCTQCNSGKMQYSSQRFIELCHRVATKHPLKENK